MNEELPKVIHILSLIGLCKLAISIIIFCIYMALFNQARDPNVTVTRTNIPTTESAMMISYIVIGSIGFLFCLCIPFAHHLKSYNDPSIVSSRNGMNFERYDGNEKKLKAIDVVKPSKYKLVGSQGSDIIAKNISGFSNNSIEKFL